jgi:hypothetical protein
MRASRPHLTVGVVNEERLERPSDTFQGERVAIDGAELTDEGEEDVEISRAGPAQSHHRSIVTDVAVCVATQAARRFVA